MSYTSRKPTRSTRVADALEEQEQSDSEGPAVKKYRTMLTTDRGAFDKEAAGFLRNLWGQGTSEGGEGELRDGGQHQGSVVEEG